MRTFGRSSAVLSILLTLAVVLGICTKLNCQENTGRILGTVHDSSGAVIDRAQVNVEHTGTGLHSETVTNGEGAYVFPSLPIGEYELSISKPGFATVVQRASVLSRRYRQPPMRPSKLVTRWRP